MVMTLGMGNTLRIILMSTGILFIAILFSVSFPSFFSSTFSELPTVWSSFKAWLRPPYLYIIINAIILSIAASSLLHSPPPQLSPHAPSKPPSSHRHDVIPLPADHFSPYDAVSVTELVTTPGSFYGAVSVKDNVDVEVVGSVVVEELKTQPPARVDLPEIRGGREESSAVKRSTWDPPPLVRQKPFDSSPEFSSPERPPASSRFGHHRRAAKASPSEGGKALRVAKSKRHETLEGTWKAITEGRHMPLTRHLKKSDTWEHHCRQINLLDDPIPPLTQVKKSETFKDRTNQSPPPVTLSRLKKEPSLSQDELNRRVEAFIKKFNEEMRLQRQQSMQQFLEKINRAA